MKAALALAAALGVAASVRGRYDGLWLLAAVALGIAALARLTANEGERMYDISAEVLELGHRSGLLAEWAEVTAYDPGRRLIIRRRDTDGLELTVALKDIRRAIRRTTHGDPSTLGLSGCDAESIARAVMTGEVTPEDADDLIQIAAIGRATYGDD